MNYTYYRRYQPRQKKSSFRSFFWFVVFLVIIVLILKACVSFAGNLMEEKRDEAILSLEKGSAEVLLWGQDEWQEVSSSQMILEGDSVRTAAGSYATLEFYQGTEVKMDENSELVFTDVLAEDLNDFVTIDLKDGRAWLNHQARERGQMEFLLKTDVLNVNSMYGQYLLSNIVDNEYLYVMDGQSTVEFVDRSDGEDSVIETLILNDESKVTMDDNKQRALLSRDDVTLSEVIEEGELDGDAFVTWSMGGSVAVEDEEEVEDTADAEDTEGEDVDEPIEESIEEPIEEPVMEEEALKISVSSPVSGVTIQEDAIAIEGYISSGEASSVYVTWSGNGQPYALGLFEAGSDSFRYVADAEYANFAVGQNTYTIVAYDADGNISNTVTVVINAEF